jgi:hypothetical protein
MGSTMRRHLVAFVAAALLAMGGSGQAQHSATEAPAETPPEETRPPAPLPLLEAPDKPLPPRPDNFRFHKSRRITNFTTGTDSPCIGDATTPRCAIDTYIAWWVRRDPSLDWIVPNFRSAGRTPPWKDPDWFLIDYTILYLGRVRKSMMPWELEWRPAPHTLLAVIVPMRCTLGRDIAEKDWDCYFINGNYQRRYFLLKRRAHRWIVDSTYSPQI